MSAIDLAYNPDSASFKGDYGLPNTPELFQGAEPSKMRQGKRRKNRRLQAYPWEDLATKLKIS